MVLILSVLTQ